MSIGGKVRADSGSYSKFVGIFECAPVSINPTAREYQELTGEEPKEDDKRFEYLGTSKDGNETVRVTVYLKEVKNGGLFPVSFFIENKVRRSKAAEGKTQKTQYINAQGSVTWAETEAMIKPWFAKFDFREALVGEEELYLFLRAWLHNLDYRDSSTLIYLPAKSLLKGVVKDLKDQVGGTFGGNLLAIATIRTNAEGKEFQSVNNKFFLPAYNSKNFGSKQFTLANTAYIRDKPLKERKAFEKFIVEALDPEFGVRDFMGAYLGTIREYNPEENPATQEEALIQGDLSYAADDSEF